MSSVKYVAGNFATNLLIFPLAFIGSVIISRILGAEGRGVYVYVLLIANFFLPYICMGFNAGILYSISTKKYNLNNSFFTVILMALVFSVPYIVLLYMAFYFGWFGEIGQHIDSRVLLIISLIITCNLIYNFLSKAIIASDMFTTDNLMRMIAKIGSPILVIIMLMIVSDEIFGAVLGVLLVCIIQIAWIVKAIYKRYNPTFSIEKEFVSHSFFYGIKGWFGHMANSANARLDQLLVGNVVKGSAGLGNYNISVQLSEMIYIPVQSVGQVMYNRIAKDKNVQNATQLVERVHRVLFYFTVLICIVVAFNAHWFIPLLYGSDFRFAVEPLLILLPGSLAMITTKVLNKFQTASGNIHISNKVNLITSAISIGLCIVLIPRYGIIGAALATTCAYIVSAMVAIFYYYKRVNRFSALFSFTYSDYKWCYMKVKSLLVRSF